MFDDIAQYSDRQDYAETLKKYYKLSYRSLNCKKTSHELLKEFEKSLKSKNLITFQTVYKEPLGCYMIKSFLASKFSLCKAIFASDVENYSHLKELSARQRVASLIFKRFILPETDENVDQSVFTRLKSFFNKFEAESKTIGENSKVVKTFHYGKGNCIGFYDKKVIERVSDCIRKGETSPRLFDEIYKKIMFDLKYDLFPRFMKSEFYLRYLSFKVHEEERVSKNDFEQICVLGNGAFGIVYSAIKKKFAKLYAIKCLSKRHVIACDQIRAVANEKNNLSKMNSPFVTCLKYSFMDKENLYFVLDLMPKGDLKQQLNKCQTFGEEVSKFYAAEILLGLQHIHEHGIIYRDIKLENILLDINGHVKISDLGLSVCKKKVKGYAGTPGYTAPEVIQGDLYDRVADFFSFGVIIYRFLTGKKPFGEHMNDLDKNVVSIEPKYPKKYLSSTAISLIKSLLIKNPRKRLGSGDSGIEEIKNHEWFSSIDFGLLEAGYIDPPWVPENSKISESRKNHAGKAAHVKSKKYKKVKIPSDFNKIFADFDFVSKSAVQSEIVEALERIEEKQRLTEEDEEELENEKHLADCCVIM